MATQEPRDCFISHASEDKDAVARPLAEALTSAGCSVWFDEYELVLGDSLRARIDEGLAASRFGVVILSPQFFEKGWPQSELDALAAKEMVGGEQLILPIWHGVDEKFLARKSPLLTGRIGAPSHPIDKAVAQIVRAIERRKGQGATAAAIVAAQEPSSGSTIPKSIPLDEVNAAEGSRDGGDPGEDLVRPRGRARLALMAIALVLAIAGAVATARGVFSTSAENGTGSEGTAATKAPHIEGESDGQDQRQKAATPSRRPEARLSPKVLMRPRRFWFGDTGADTQVKIKPSITNHTGHSVDISAGADGPIYLAIEAQKNRARDWPAPASTDPLFVRSGRFLLIPANDPGAVVSFPPSFATYWSRTSLGPGETWFDPDGPDRATRDNDLVFSVPSSLSGSVALAYKVPGRKPRLSTAPWPERQSNPREF